MLKPLRQSFAGLKNARAAEEYTTDSLGKAIASRRGRRCSLLSLFLLTDARSMADKKIQLYYHDCKGYAEVARLILTAAGKEFEDIRFQSEDWPKFKPLSPFNKSPFIVLDGETYGESPAFNVYLAKEFGFHGKTNLESLKVDQVVSLASDLVKYCVDVLHIENEEERKKGIEKTKLEESPKYLALFEKLLTGHKSPYFVGDRLTLADIFVFDVVTGMTENYVDVNDNYLLLRKNVETVRAHSKIGPYMISRPVRSV